MMHLNHLPNAGKNEYVVLFLRRNWLTVFSIVAVFVLMLALPAGVAFFFRDWVELLLAKPVIGAIATLITSVYVLCVWLFTFLEFTDFYLDTWIVTNERILSTEQKGLFNRTASELHLAAIQDVTSEMRGMIGTFLDFGDVHIQTAGEKTRFHFDNVDHPEKIKEQIVRLIEEDKKRHAGSLIAAMAEGEKSPEETA
jgi:membrane protein YdbS with pleckstrin-like domain